MRVELWQKLQICLLQSFKFASGELGTKPEEIKSETIKLLASTLCAQQFGQMRDVAVLEYLLKAAYKVKDELAVLDLIQLFDALYKS